MPVLQGNQTRVAIQNESSYATAAGDIVWPGVAVSEWKADVDEGVTAERYVGAGSGRNISRFQRGDINVKGNLTGEPENALLLAYFFGKNTATGSPTYTNTLNESGTLPSLLAEDNKFGTTNFTETVIGNVVNEFTWEGAQGEHIRCTYSTIAQNGSPSTGSNAFTHSSGAELDVFKFNHLSVRASGTVGLNGPVTEVIGFKVHGNNGVIPPHYAGAGSRVIQKPIPDSRNYDLSLSLYNPVTTGTTIYQGAFRGGSEVNIDLFFLRVSGAVSGAGTDFVQFWLSGCKTMACDHPSEKEAPLPLDWTLQPSSCGVIEKVPSGNYWTYII